MTDLNALKEILTGKVTRDEENRPTHTRKVYEESLPEGMTMADIKRMEHHNGRYRAASFGVLAEACLNDLVADESLGHVDLVSEFGAEQRMTSRVYRNNVTGKGDKAKNNFGHATPVIHMGDEPEFLDAMEGIQKRARGLWDKK